MAHVAVGFFDQLANVLHHLVGLLGRVVAVDVDRIIQVLRALSPQINGLAALGDNGLTQVVVQVLLRVRLGRVELAYARVSHVLDSV
ncbi:hypothetical protein TRL7639_04286 [Falsiruegeria litorea R37]|uniref:Uncharacterized protein n=1 Tax=Falsiruegeria litorea R37 TaxID=1200284 RepID=A0A1Y5TZC9_9RHOB|nr:hypothetical protein TRL7639_04286 [Falsiruegeria litorea R37]